MVEFRPVLKLLMPVDVDVERLISPLLVVLKPVLKLPTAVLTLLRPVDRLLMPVEVEVLRLDTPVLRDEIPVLTLLRPVDRLLMPVEVEVLRELTSTRVLFT